MNISKLIKVSKMKSIPILLLISNSVCAANIDSIVNGSNSDGAYEIQIVGNDFKGVTSYSLNNPARIVVDIPHGKSNLVNSIKSINSEIVSDVAIIEGDDRVRATINMSKLVPYTLIDTSEKITIAVKDPSKGKLSKNKSSLSKKASSNNGVAKINFVRGASGQGTIKIKLPNSDAVVNVERIGTKVVAKMRGAKFSRSKKMNVTDFGTPVKNIDVYKKSLNINTSSDDFEIVSYQNDDIFTIELARPLIVKQDQNEIPPGDSRREYKGESLSLNFQDIEVRSVLQLIGDFTNTNIVISGDVQGTIALRLNDVPWDQALDIILQTKGLSMQKNGNVIYVAPSEVIAKNLKATYEISSVKQDLAPLQQQLIQVQYARAENLLKILESGRKNKSDENSQLLSSRGHISVDKRTNTLIVNEVPSNIDKIRRLVSSLDRVVSQVLIDARIVSASNNFAHELGVRWGGIGSKVGKNGDGVLVAGSGGGTAKMYNNANKARKGEDGEDITLGDRIGVNLGTTRSPYGSLGVMVLGGDLLLDLELSAMQDNGRGEVISSPRVITQDGNSADIKSGTEIPYSTVDKDGVVTIQFKPVLLSLEATPKIAPNNKVDMILKVHKDTVGAITSTATGGSVPTVDTNSVNTQVLVDSGETVVLGGVYEQTKTKAVSKVPVLGDIPYIGRAFRRDTNTVKKRELLIFVTPKIIDKRFVSRDKFSELRN
ncbi:MAG: type IV pilus secretin PilQ [Gammaproteobacteria bacterium]|nr:type IV pilus secretin PilQ [Gammaproteobacteria bacterium]